MEEFSHRSEDMRAETEDMRAEQAIITKNSLVESIARLRQHMQQSMVETICMVEEVIDRMRIAPEPGPVLTASMADGKLEVLWTSGNAVSGSGNPVFNWTHPLDVASFKALLQGVLDCVQLNLKVGAIYDDQGVQLEDTHDVSCLTRLTVGTAKANHSLQEAVFIEHCLQGPEFKQCQSDCENAIKKCQRDCRDIIVAMAWDGDRDIFIDKVTLVYEEFGGLNREVRAQLLLAYHKRWPKNQEPRIAWGGPRPKRRAAPTPAAEAIDGFVLN